MYHIETIIRLSSGPRFNNNFLFYRENRHSKKTLIIRPSEGIFLISFLLTLSISTLSVNEVGQSVRTNIGERDCVVPNPRLTF